MSSPAEIATQIERIRRDVEREGGATVGRDDLRIICPEEFTVSEQFMRIAEIARTNGWSFAFLPNGCVQFGAYAKA